MKLPLVLMQVAPIMQPIPMSRYRSTMHSSISVLELINNLIRNFMTVFFFLTSATITILSPISGKPRRTATVVISHGIDAVSFSYTACETSTALINV